METIVANGKIIRGKLRRLSGNFFTRDQTRLDVRRNDFVVIVRAVVVIKIKVVDTGKQMIVEPLF